MTVELPTGSDISGKAGSLRAEGRLGTVDLALNAGDARVAEAEHLTLNVSAGSVAIGRTSGTTFVKANAGSVRVTELAGEGTIRSSAGATTVGTVTGSLQVAGVHGDIVVGTVSGALTAKAASGGIRVDRVESGTVALTTSYGSIEVGVPEGTTAWLDIASEHGTLRNELLPTDGPVADRATAEIQAGTGYGDVIIRRP